MHPTRFIHIVIMLASLFWSMTCRGAHFDLYLLAGQSNMDGRGKNTDLTDQQRAPFTNVIIFYRNLLISSQDWKPLSPGFSVPPGYKSKELPSPAFGPEIGFALHMTKAQPSHQFAFIKGSHGGTSLSKDWKPGIKGKPDSFGRCYKSFMETVSMATQSLTNSGHTFTYCGILWHQGESDASSTKEVYLKQLTQFIFRIREDIGSPDLPLVIGEVYDNGKRDSVRQAQLEASKSIPHVAFASAADTKTWDSGTHFDAASQLLLGERFASAMLKLTHAK